MVVEGKEILNNLELKQLECNVRAHLSDDCTGHDWWHIKRVRNLARYIAEKEGADIALVDITTLLHDVDDWKFKQPTSSQYEKAVSWLSELSVKQSTIDRIVAIIEESSFKGANVNAQCTSLEAEILQDADRLDAIGAIGIARAFAYGGFKNRPIYSPDVPVMLHETASAYKNHKGTTINHFYEKLLLLKDRMNTNTAKMIANKRHDYLKSYMRQFLLEWDFN